MKHNNLQTNADHLVGSQLILISSSCSLSSYLVYIKILVSENNDILVLQSCPLLYIKYVNYSSWWQSWILFIQSLYNKTKIDQQEQLLKIK